MARSAKEIEQDILQLNEDQLREFRAWYEEFSAKAWDDQIMHDATSGKLDDLANQALRDHEAGRSRPL